MNKTIITVLLLQLSFFVNAQLQTKVNAKGNGFYKSLLCAGFVCLADVYVLCVAVFLSLSLNCLQNDNLHLLQLISTRVCWDLLQPSFLSVL